MQDREGNTDEWAAIDRVWDLTRAIGAASTLHDWPEAARLAAERSPLLMSLSAPRSEAARDILRAIHAADQTIVVAAQSDQAALQHAYEHAMNSLQNVGKYQQAAQF